MIDNEQYKRAIAQRISTLISTKFIKQKDLAHAIGVTDNTISYFCKGTRTPNIQQIIQIARYFGVSVDYLLGLTENQTTDEDVKTACKVTGLSEGAIKNIVAAGDADFLDCLLSNIDLDLIDSINSFTAIKAVSRIFREECIISFCYLNSINIEGRTIDDCFEMLKHEKGYILFENDINLRFASNIVADGVNTLWDSCVKLDIDQDYEEYKINTMTAGYIKKLIPALEVKMIEYLESIGQRKHIKQMIEKSVKNAQHNTEEE